MVEHINPQGIHRTITGLRVHGLANPDFLVEIEAVAGCSRVIHGMKTYE